MYEGSSCQNPGDGYYRYRETITESSHLHYEHYVGRSVACECNGRSNRCNKETGYCEVRISLFQLSHYSNRFLQHMSSKNFNPCLRCVQITLVGLIAKLVLMDFMEIRKITAANRVLVQKLTATLLRDVHSSMDESVVVVGLDTLATFVTVVVQDFMDHQNKKAAVVSIANVICMVQFPLSVMHSLVIVCARMVLSVQSAINVLNRRQFWEVVAVKVTILDEHILKELQKF